MILWKHELRMNKKVLLFWSFGVGIICFGCLLLFESLADTIAQMAGFYASLGMFAKAFGMDRLNIGTVEGFYATEIAMVFSIGGAMFAAQIGASLLAKEEEGHTGEFLHALPFTRTAVVGWKYLAMLAMLLVFQMICMLWELAGMALIGGMPNLESYVWYHAAQILLQFEVGSICFLISAISRKKQLGGVFSLAVFLYLADMLCRVIPGIEWLKYVTPYYFSNAADIFTKGRPDAVLAAVCCAVTVLTGIGALLVYKRRDLAS